MGSLAKKLHLKPNAAALIINAPVSYLEELGPLPEGVGISETPRKGAIYDFVQLFVKDRRELTADLEWVRAHLRPETVFWITYPKKSSGIPSDLEMLRSWDELAKHQYTGVASAAINEVWTALRWKPKSHVKSDEACKERIPNNQYSQYIDLQNRVITPPGELKALLDANPLALQSFGGLSFTNKKEYVVWIVSAKQDKTKADRLGKTLAKLLAGKKNPSEK